MQKYAKINAGDKVVDALLALNDTHETLVSQNSGAAFPTTNLVVGMKCFRTDQNKTYTLKAVSPAAWVLTEDLNKDIYDADTFGGKKPADYAHLTSDGNLHVPATGTSNNGKVLMAGSTAGNFSWQNLPAAYSHPSGDGNLHVPATGTTNKGKVLKAGATAGSFSWDVVAASEISGLPTSLPANGGNAATVGGKTVDQIISAADVTGAHGFRVFTSNGTFVVPSGVTQVLVTLCSAGGGGGGSSKYSQSGGDGGNGYALIKESINVTSGASIAITVGVGGSGGGASSNGTTGGATSFGTLLTLLGGNGGGGAPSGSMSVGSPGTSTSNSNSSLVGFMAMISGRGLGGAGGVGNQVSGNAGKSGILVVEW